MTSQEQTRGEQQVTSPRIAALVAAVSEWAPGVSAAVEVHSDAVLGELRAAGASTLRLGGTEKCPHRFTTATLQLGSVRLTAIGEIGTTEVAS